MRTQTYMAAGLALVALAAGFSVRADMATEWNATLVAAATASTSTVAARKAAIVQVAVHDAVNGIELYPITARSPGKPYGGEDPIANIP